MRNKRVFVSGGAGVIGTILVDLLLAQGADVFVADLQSCPKAWLGKVKYQQGDLKTISSQELLEFDPEFYFHLAGELERNEESYSYFEENFLHNLTISHTLLHKIKQAPSLKRIIFSSSYLVYDPFLYLSDDPAKIPASLSENAPLLPLNIYAAAKLYHEIELRFFNEYLGTSFSCISIRLFRVYGNRHHDCISRWIRCALQQEPISVYHLQEKSDFLFAEDAAEGILKLALTSFQGVVNLGTGKSIAIEEVIDILRENFPKLTINYRPTSIPFELLQANIDRLKSLTNWQPTHTLKTAIPKIIEFEKKFITEHSIQKHTAVLITSISKKMPLIESVRLAANKMGQFQEIHGCDSQNDCIGQYGVDKFWHCPLLENLTIDNMITYCHDNRITAIIPTRDADLKFYAKHLQSFHQHGIYPMVSTFETIESCLDKKKFAELLELHHFPVIPTYLSLEDCHSNLYVVKERRGAGSNLLGLCLSYQEAQEHGQKLSQPLFQPFIAGQEWSVDLYRSFEGKIKGCVARQRNNIVNGESQVTTTMRYPALEGLCQKMADLLNLHGHVIFQVIEDKKGDFHVIECNPRFGGASTASLAAGLDSFVWFFVECLGLNLRDYPFMRCKGELRQVRYMTDRLLPWSSYLI